MYRWQRRKSHWRERQRRMSCQCTQGSYQSMSNTHTSSHTHILTHRVNHSDRGVRVTRHSDSIWVIHHIHTHTHTHTHTLRWVAHILRWVEWTAWTSAVTHVSFQPILSHQLSCLKHTHAHTHARTHTHAHTYKQQWYFTVLLQHSSGLSSDRVCLIVKVLFYQCIHPIIFLPGRKIC